MRKRCRIGRPLWDLSLGYPGLQYIFSMVREAMVMETLKLLMVRLPYAEGFRVLANPRGPPAIPERLMII